MHGVTPVEYISLSTLPLLSAGNISLHFRRKNLWEERDLLLDLCVLLECSTLRQAPGTTHSRHCARTAGYNIHSYMRSPFSTMPPLILSTYIPHRGPNSEFEATDLTSKWASDPCTFWGPFLGVFFLHPILGDPGI